MNSSPLKSIRPSERKLRALIVEDSEGDAKLVTHALAQHGYDVDWERVENGEAMRAALEQKAWDVVLADYRLPHFSGPAALTVLKQTGLDLPFIVISGTIGEEAAVDMLKTGAIDFVMKGNLTRLFPAIERGIKETHTRRELRQQSAALNAAANAIVIANRDGRIEWINRAFTTLTGYNIEEAVGSSPRILKSGKHDQAFYRAMWETILAGKVWRGELINRRKDGTFYPEEMTITPLRDDRGEITHFIAVKQDNTDRMEAEENLRQSEHKYRELFENLTDAAFLFECERGRILDCNRRAEALLGRSRSDILGMHHEELHPAADAARCRELFARSSGGAPCVEVEAEVLSKEGTCTPVAINCSMLTLHGRALLLALFRDVSERNRAKDALREKDELLRQVSGIARIGGWEFDATTRRGLWTEEVANIHELDHTVEPTVELGLSFFADEARQELELAVNEAVEFGKPYELELEMVTAKGKRKWVRTIGVPLREGDRIVKVRGTMQDITERKRAEEELRAANERYADQEEALIALTRTAASHNGESMQILREIAEVTARTLDVGRVSVWRHERDRRDIACTELYERKEHQHSSGAILKADDYPAYFRALAEADVIAAHDAHHDSRTAEFSAGYLTPLGIGAMLDAPIQMQGVTTGVLCCEHLGRERRWTSDEQTFAVAAANLVSLVLMQEERKKLEAQFLRAQRMESIGTLASGVAHDLNNILAPILISAPLLRMELPPEQRESILSGIESSAERGAQVVKQVLAFGRGLGGEKHALRLGALIKELLKIMRETFPKDIQIESSSESRLWSVVGDATQLHQVLLNLCVNARDAMPDGGKLRLETANYDLDAGCASMIPGANPGPHVVLKVSDTGTGIAPEVLEHIFDPFFTTKGLGKGTGLGLSTVHGLVAEHGGFVDVDSHPGKGTTFSVYIPAVVEGDATAAELSRPQSPTGHGELVLVVDDERAVAAAVRRVLETHGYRVLLAPDGAEAAARFAQEARDVALVLTDLMMPLMDGMALIRVIRKIKPSQPVIASTGLGEKARLAELKTLGVETVLHKPYNAHLLLSTVHDLLHAAASTPSAN